MKRELHKPSKIFIYDTQTQDCYFAFKYQLDKLLNIKIQNYITTMTNDSNMKDKIYLYCYTYKSRLKVKTAHIVDLLFTEEQYTQFTQQLQKKYKDVKCYVIKGVMIYAKEIANKLRK